MASEDQEVVLITGANTGLGYELARQLLQDHRDRFYVLVGSRTPSKGEAAVKTLHDQGLKHCELVEIDVTSDTSISAAAHTVEAKFGKLDVLHVNAGIAHADMEPTASQESLSKRIMMTMATNVAGAAQTAEAFVPLLLKAENPRLVFTGSTMGSLQVVSDVPSRNKNWPAYSSSKAALNMVLLYFVSLYGNDIRINGTCPGFRATALNGFGQGAPKGLEPGSMEGGARSAVRLTLLGKDGESGTFTDWQDGADEPRTIPW